MRSLSTLLLAATLAACSSSPKPQQPATNLGPTVSLNSNEAGQQDLPTDKLYPSTFCYLDGKAYSKGAVVEEMVCSEPSVSGPETPLI